MLQRRQHALSGMTTAAEEKVQETEDNKSGSFDTAVSEARFQHKGCQNSI